MKFLLFIPIALITGCLASMPEQHTRVDEVPMYGGIDRSKFPELIEADEQFISGVTEAFGSREKASQLWVEQGFKFYNEDKLGMAMRRFNQAWLLNPENSEVFAGFGSVLHDQGKYCEAMQVMEKSLSLDPPSYQGIYTDAARIFTLCAVSNDIDTEEEKSILISRSEALYKEAEKLEWNKAYTYGSWATAYFWRGDYADAWLMVAKQREAGGIPGKHFIELLSSEMTEPQ
jgi:Tfp pilus assembly protein PilF